MEEQGELVQAKIKQVIQTKLIIGSGKEKEDPVRSCYQYWDSDGHLLAEHDTLKDCIMFER